MLSAVFISIIAFGAIGAAAAFICRPKNTAKRLKLLIYLFVLIFAARFLVSLAEVMSAASSLNIFETFFDSLLHSLQTFSLDEDYTSYTLLGKEYLESAGYGSLAIAYGAVISVLDVCAPIAGGAFLLEILTGIFPRVKIALHPKRRKFVFSVLSPEAVALAEDILKDENYKSCYPEPKKKEPESSSGEHENEEETGDSGQTRKEKAAESNSNDKPKKSEALAKRTQQQEKNKEETRTARMLRPLIIFTDAYLNAASEESSELFERAKAMGAVCVKTDLFHLSFRSSKNVDYFLLDEKSEGNISSLSSLLSPQPNGKLLWPKPWEDGALVSEDDKAAAVFRTRIFLFKRSPMDAAMAGRIVKREKKTAEKAIIRVIDEDKNSAINLMYEVPLFLPLLRECVPSECEDGKGRAKEPAQIEQNAGHKHSLHAAIVGSGAVARECFKAVFWCGQMLDVRLHINVYSKKAHEFEQSLREECPELFESCDEDSSLLLVHPHTSHKKNPPYANIRFFGMRDADDLLCYSKKITEKTDYYILALDKDEENIALSDCLRLDISRRLKYEGDGRAVIALCVRDTDMASSVRETAPGAFSPYVFPFGTIKESCSCKNIYMKDFTRSAFSSAALYGKKEQQNFFKDEYSYWANIARTVHAPYKLFSIGRLEKVCLDAKEEKYISADGPELTDDEDQRLAWLEHRRWNAFMRTEGFCRPTQKQYEKYYAAYGTHKCVPLKLHNCLVESNVHGDKIAPWPPAEDATAGTRLKNAAGTNHHHAADKRYHNAGTKYTGSARWPYDALDEVSIAAYLMDTAAGKPEGERAGDYKIWDYPEYDNAFNELLKEQPGDPEKY